MTIHGSRRPPVSGPIYCGFAHLHGAGDSRPKVVAPAEHAFVLVKSQTKLFVMHSISRHLPSSVLLYEQAPAYFSARISWQSDRATSVGVVRYFFR